VTGVTATRQKDLRNNAALELTYSQFNANDRGIPKSWLFPRSLYPGGKAGFLVRDLPAWLEAAPLQDRAT
jgi:hypothetical protein